MFEKIYEGIKYVLDSELSSTKIGREAGVTRQTVDSYRKGPSSIENMTLTIAEKLYNLKLKMEEIEMIKNMSIEEFYNLDEVSIESDGFYYVDPESGIDERVPTPEEAFLPEDEWNGEDYTDHLHPAYLDAWKELQDKVVEAYENI
ncbi:MAG: hypothetical protein Q4G11_06160 [Gallicola sp.]|nr:hypothetical protein [Gallicola sp.]